ncbi:DNA polymerase delta, subunit 4-domain-containing protein [Lipomyces oligophaga]|uniref:DNA polymerase delta, subunit 4-domain-containing protein n=1 Tax=Lipomyces oligophaga TaxID=45792 RepID=UPI0034CDEFDA
MVPPTRRPKSSGDKAASRQTRLPSSFYPTKRKSQTKISKDVNYSNELDDVEQLGHNETSRIEVVDLSQDQVPATEKEDSALASPSNSNDSKASTEVEEELASVTELHHLDFQDSKYTKYLKEVLKGDIAPRIPQDESQVEQILKIFDLTEKYGPASGTTRLERWQRAKRLGFQPPDIVFAILTSREGFQDESLRESYLHNMI